MDDNEQTWVEPEAGQSEGDTQPEAASEPTADQAAATAAESSTEDAGASETDGSAAAAPAADAAASLDPETPPALASAIVAALTAGPSAEAMPVALELYFLRHADAGDPMTWPGDDADRPLSKKGRNQAKRLGRLLDDLNFRPDDVLSSPRLRSLDTARIVAKRIGMKAHTDERLGIDFSEETLASLVGELGAGVERVVLVGHDPDFTHLVSWLVGASVNIRKGALARVDLADRTVSAGRGSLCWLLPPDAVAG
ncbi:MAG: phosphohistidine phosphatase [Chloroflexota bacterium]|jgi:phosphohistidine phosphatase|nr:phosphohistidine phosphatase [Chloroflexota bacterium]